MTAAAAGSWRCVAMAIGIYFTFHAPDAEFEAPGVADAGRRSRVALSGILLAWLTYQRARSISADALAVARSGRSARAALAQVLARRSSSWRSTAACCWRSRASSAGSIATSWTASLNVVSAWTLDGGDRLRRIQTGKVQDYVFARRPSALLALMAWIGVALVSGVAGASRSSRGRRSSRALVIMAFGAAPAAARALDGGARRGGVARRVALWSVTALRPARRPASSSASDSPLVPSLGIAYQLGRRRHGPRAGAADRDHHLRRRVRVVDGQDARARSSTRCCCCS